MLKQLLVEVARVGQTDVPRLAKRLGVSESLLRQMLQQLVNMGYLRPLSTDCPPLCKECSIRQQCRILWELTPKGRKILEQTK
ncbi:MAG: hypothetical protein AXA67_10420 [Methylothermaceae bacteria B42]|nr:MAG: hypothetical protein AXA67_10420 [Methylothermaceae bacteria B42]HHJ40517.1 hypothetical protein [Methylothermaceae bacterium]